ncbi:hypothetical protein [Mesorhizobium sp. L2C084A000]|uniref:hypothetical protein n=1 Tax=Mesorhizobium sp. L2C084A000 TaxID=1287116 RepID=UPI0003CFC103|nr:hypothetical protein [Mesorhizobium sp. L2C084A000]ESZ27271.1 hypothetical protein X734_12645 [Mesorhizobium sp. L2C084A000]
MRRRSHALASEVAELEAVLSRIPETSVIERFGFEQRLKTARAALGQAQDTIEPERTQLTFRGLPVKGSQGIYAEFGSKAAVAFTAAFTAILAGMKDRLNYMGPIPDKARNQLLITGTAVGSFGFEFQLPSLNPDFFSESGGAEEALERLLGLLEVSAEGTDDDVAELVAEVHPRAVRKVASFLEYLSRNQAWCGLEFKQNVFKYRNVEQLRRSRDRLSEGNIRETHEEFVGELQGVLPKGRTFEFSVSGADQILRGKVGIGIEDPDILNREWLHKPVRVSLNVVQVGKSRPSYILADLERISRV